MENTDSLDNLVAQVQGLSGCTEDLAHLASILKQSEEAISAKGAPRLHIAISLLDPAVHSLGYLFFLDAQSCDPLPKDQAEEFLNTAIHFINVCSKDQIQLAPEKFTMLCKSMKESALQLNSPMRVVLPLHNAILKLQPSPQYLTALHAEFFLVCVLAKCYTSASVVLEEQIFEIDPKKCLITPKDFLLYCYYGGMLCIGLKKFAKALEFFHHAITAPATVLSAIVVESYKKFILVSLIENGQVPSFPKYTPAVSIRYLKTCTQDYLELANSFSTRNISDLQRCVASHEDAFKKDSNLGLVKQVVSSLYKRNIQRLTQTYVTLSLEDIASTVQLASPKDAELYILRMIQEGEIFAVINQKDGMVCFHEDPEQYKTTDITQRLDEKIRQIISLERKVTSMDEHISCDQAYLSRVGRDRSRYDLEDYDLVPQKMFQTS
ncbi:hypothetical protein KP509_30G021500 [Ceratopteris richardii]|uniref:COP9 signalosome complex subunit 3 n=1 Tax=Ceratopteris richardii TaxID=49495 RepID=A0A8T2R222_CERRI|nr:hypothetical protein KP509_30G021500 [Ceratopteris richardii]